MKIRDSPSAEPSRAPLLGKLLADINEIHTYKLCACSQNDTTRKSNTFWSLKISEPIHSFTQAS